MPDIAEQFAYGDWADPERMPERQRRLHRRILRAERASRTVKPSDVDESGRAWPGLTNPTIEESTHAK